MTEEKEADTLPEKRAFLERLQSIADATSKLADEETLKHGGRAAPATLDELGALLELIYGLATCGWGCKGGDHQIEYLLGRVVNQVVSAHRLMRCGMYDEA